MFPDEFRSKVACENDNMPLMCNPYSRIAIYSASFGHTERESVQCGGQGGGAAGNVLINREESGQPSMCLQPRPVTRQSSLSLSLSSCCCSSPACLVSYATETVMQICHGRRRCSVTADAGTFGRPCKTDVRMYLKVVYTCSEYSKPDCLCLLLNSPRLQFHARCSRIATKLRPSRMSRSKPISTWIRTSCTTRISSTRSPRPYRRLPRCRVPMWDVPLTLTRATRTRRPPARCCRRCSRATMPI